MKRYRLSEMSKEPRNTAGPGIGPLAREKTTTEFFRIADRTFR
jgi:hypothetical protein